MDEVRLLFNLLMPAFPGADRCLRQLGTTALLVVVVTSAARASTTDAWKAYGQQVLRACSAASTLRQPRPAGDRLDLPGENGSQFSVLMLEGTYPQVHMAGRRGLELCLYNARSQKVRVIEAEGLVRKRP